MWTSHPVGSPGCSSPSSFPFRTQSGDEDVDNWSFQNIYRSLGTGSFCPLRINDLTHGHSRANCTKGYFLQLNTEVGKSFPSSSIIPKSLFYDKAGIETAVLHRPQGITLDQGLISVFDIDKTLGKLKWMDWFLFCPCKTLSTSWFLLLLS